jgi:hypothetical protein
MRESAPQWVHTACGHLIDTLWPDIEFPEIRIFVDDGIKDQGLMQAADIGGVAVMTLNKSHLFADFMDSISSIAHELAHLVVHLADANEADDHGPNWRWVMDDVGLHVVPGEARETVVRGGPFWDAFQSLMPILLQEGCAPAAKGCRDDSAMSPVPAPQLPALRPATCAAPRRHRSCWDAKTFDEMPGLLEPNLPPDSSAWERFFHGNILAGFK